MVYIISITVTQAYIKTSKILNFLKLFKSSHIYFWLSYTIYPIQCITYYVEIKCQLDAREVFIADLIACSTCFRHHYAHHQELKSIIQWLLPVVFHAMVLKLLVWCGAEGYVSGLQEACCSAPDRKLENHSTKYHRQQPLYNTLELLMMGIVVPETC